MCEERTGGGGAAAAAAAAAGTLAVMFGPIAWEYT